jgi:hypothetical protein
LTCIFSHPEILKKKSQQFFYSLSYNARPTHIDSAVALVQECSVKKNDASIKDWRLRINKRRRGGAALVK